MLPVTLFIEPCDSQPRAVLLFRTPDALGIDVIASLRAAKARHEGGETTAEQLGMEKTGILQHAHYHSEQLQQASRDSILHFARPARNRVEIIAVTVVGV